MAVQMHEPMRRVTPTPVPSLRVLVVVPTYYEIENIGEVLTRARRALPDATILVVDDDSPDGTADRVQMLSARLGDVGVLRRAGKQGLGSAYRAGFRHGLAEGYDVLVEMDADLSHDPGVLPELVAAVEAGADLVIGSRYVPGGSVPGWPWVRRLISRAGGTYARAMLRVPVTDATSGFRAYRADAVEAIGLDRVRADGYGFQVEMAYRVHTIGGEIAEIPIVFRDRTLGRSKMSARVVFEALVLVTRWGVRDRISGTRTRPATGLPAR
jgi:dolichol-phosphate mannosyltransferase